MEKIKKLILVFCASLLIGCNQSNEAGLVYGDNNAEIEVVNYTKIDKKKRKQRKKFRRT